MKTLLVMAAMAAIPAAASAQSLVDLVDAAPDVAEGVASAGQSSACAFSNSWDSDSFSTFRHVIEGPAGRTNLVIEAQTSSPGGETVAVYPVDSNGVRKGGRIMFVIASRNGNSSSGSVTLPKPPRGSTTSAFPLMVVVENASGQPYNGDYCLKVMP